MESENVLIANFIGIRWHHNGTVSAFPSALKMRMGVDTAIDLKFDTSWDWLMPACKKWDEINFREFGKSKREQYMALCNDLDSNVSMYEITPAFAQLVHNIKWYNAQKV